MLRRRSARWVFAEASLRWTRLPRYSWCRRVFHLRTFKRLGCPAEGVSCDALTPSCDCFLCTYLGLPSVMGRGACYLALKEAALPHDRVFVFSFLMVSLLFPPEMPPASASRYSELRSDEAKTKRSTAMPTKIRTAKKSSLLRRWGYAFRRRDRRGACTLGWWSGTLVSATVCTSPDGTV